MKPNLKHYSALAAAFIAAKSEANAQIIYTDIKDDTIYPREKYDLDLNNDGIVDFELSNNIGQHSISSTFFSTLSQAISPYGHNQIMGSANSAYALQCENLIENNLEWISGKADLAMNVTSVHCSSSACSHGHTYHKHSGNWIYVNDGYLGLRVVNGMDTLYGWVRMDVNVKGALIIKDYAYEADHGSTLLAGNLPCLNYKLESLPPGPFSGCPNPGFRFSVGNNCSAFQWYRNDTPIPGADSNVYVADTTGFYYVTGESAYGCKDTSNTTQVITDAAPAKPNIIRIADTLVSSSADKYQWLEENVQISGATNQKFIPKENSNNFEVSVAFDSGTCYTPSDSFTFRSCDLIDRNIYDRDGNIVTDSLRLCNNDYIQLSLSYNYSFHWFKDGLEIFENVNYCPFLGRGLYYCSITDADTTCPSNSVYADYATSPVIYRQQDTLISSLHAEKYNWYLNYIPIAGATNQKYRATSNGKYLLQVFYNDRCSFYSYPFVVGDITSVEDLSLNVLPRISFFSTKLLQIQFLNSGFLQGKIKIINALGQTVREISIESNEVQIPFTENENGWFVLEIEKDEHRYFSPVVIF